jgi:hypothetical protein
MEKSTSFSRLRIRRLALTHYAAAVTAAASGGDGIAHLVNRAIVDLHLGSAPNQDDADRLLYVYMQELRRVVQQKRISAGSGPFWIGFTVELLGYTCIALAGLAIWIATSQ